MGIYLLCCLGFVIFALIEFAITLLLHQKKDSNLKSETKSDKNAKRRNSCVISQNIKVKPTATELKLATPGAKPVESAGKMVSSFSITNVIDFMAVWIYFILFLVFNYIYWKSYQIEG